MLRRFNHVFSKSFSTSSLEHFLKNNPPTDIEIFSQKPTKPSDKPEYEDEYKPNPDYNQDHYKE